MDRVLIGEYDNQKMKISICGDSKSGKTLLACRLLDIEYDSYIKTIGVDIYTLTYDGEIYSIFDIGEQHISYLSNSDLIIITEDKSNYWHSVINDYYPSYKVIKLDQIPETRKGCLKLITNV